MTLDCEICGEPVVLTPTRYVALVKAGRRPRCVKNGCVRLCGPCERSGDAKIPGTAREPEVLATIDVPLVRVLWPKRKKGRKNGALAKLTVSRDEGGVTRRAVTTAERLGTCCEVGRNWCSQPSAA